MYRFPSTKQAVRGLSSDDKIIIGFEDGSIWIFRYDKETNKLVVVSTNLTLHSGRINQITEVSGKIIIASSDGKLSVSDLVVADLVTVDVTTFPEPIYICRYIDVANKTYIAAGKNTVYICIDGRIVKQRSYDSEITGISYSIHGYVIATRRAYYHGPGTLIVDEIDKLEEDSSQTTPNMSISPDGSLRATVTQNGMDLYDIEGHARLYSIPGRYADGHHLQAYCPLDYWITMSTGHSIATVDLQIKHPIMYFAPEISDKDLSEGNFPMIRTLWYENGGNAMFALLSDNTVRWWKIEYGPKSFVVGERLAAEAKARAEAANPTPNPVPEPSSDDQPIIPPLVEYNS